MQQSDILVSSLEIARRQQAMLDRAPRVILRALAKRIDHLSAREHFTPNTKHANEDREAPNVMAFATILPTVL